MTKFLSLLFLCFSVSAFSPAAHADDSLPAHLRASNDYENIEEYDNHDPMEGLNRAIFGFNRFFDGALLEPIARGYRFVTPDLAETGVRNVFRNLGEPVNMLNAILQGDPKQAFTSFWRFVLNSTFGLGGTVDFAGTYGNLPYRKEDFGQTLGTWGVPSGPYLVLPLLGPSSLRDGPARAVDAASNPWNYILHDEALITEKVLGIVSARAEALPFTDDVKRNALDPYATIRSSFLQRRVALIENR